MVRWNLRHKSHCPMCNEDQEDTTHIMLCQSEMAITQFDDTLRTILKKLLRLKTCFYALAAIRNELYSWRRKLTPPDIAYLPYELQLIILQQRQVGWKLFLEGFLVKRWSHYMQTYYLSQGTKNSGKLWAKRAVKYLWEATFELWEFRNKQLHETDKLHELEGLATLKSAVKAEWNLGLGQLPASDFSHYFTMSLEKLMKFTVDYLKSWFMIVRQGRIMMDKRNIIEDEFTTSKTLQQWVGISYEVTEEEGRQCLDIAVEEEWKLGSNQFMNDSTKSFFDHPVRDLLQLDTDNLKTWFVAVRHARMQGNAPIMKDEFSYDGALREWVGL